MKSTSSAPSPRPLSHTLPKLLPALLGSLTCSLLSACPAPNNSQNPQTQASALATAQLQALVTDSAGKAASGVKLHFTHPLESGLDRVSDGSGLADLTGLKAGTAYLLTVTGAGFISREQIVQVPNAASKGTPLQLKVVLEKAGFALEGRITDASGQAVAGAAIVAGDTSVETNSDGKFSLSLASAPAEITANKQGYRSCTVSGSGCQLQTQPIARRLRTIDNRQPLGLSANDFNSQAASLLADSRSAGYEVMAWPGQELDPARDTLWLAAPAQAVSADEIRQLVAFVKAGGKLVVSSEWAGFGQLNLESLRNLLSNFGLAPGSDTLHQDSSLSIKLFATDHPLVSGLKQLSLYRSGSVQLLQANKARLLAYSSADGYRISASVGGQGVLGSAVSGKGKVVAIGDSSLWLEDDADGNGVKNYAEADNSKLWKNVLSW